MRTPFFFASSFQSISNTASFFHAVPFPPSNSHSVGKSAFFSLRYFFRDKVNIIFYGVRFIVVTLVPVETKIMYHGMV